MMFWPVTFNVSAFIYPLSNTPSNASIETFIANTANLTLLDLVTAPSGPKDIPVAYRWVQFSVSLMLLIVGFLGNVLVVLVVLRWRSMHTPANCYLVSLAVADCLVLVTAIPPQCAEVFQPGRHWIWGPALCKILACLTYLGADMSSLSVAAFTIERYLCVCHPMKAQRMLTLTRAKRIVAGLWTFGVLYCSPWLYLAETKHIVYASGVTVTLCGHKLPHGSQILLSIFMTDFVMFYAVPLLISCSLYGLLGRMLIIGRLPKRRYQPTESPSSAAGQRLNSAPENHDADCAITATRDTGAHVTRVGASMATTTSLHQQVPASAHDRTINYIAKTGMQVVKMLFVVVALFAVFSLPYRAALVFNRIAPRRLIVTNAWFWLLCRLLIYANSALNPILYSAMSVKFRQSFVKLVRCQPANLAHSTPRGAPSRPHLLAPVVMSTGRCLSNRSPLPVEGFEMVADRGACSVSSAGPWSRRATLSLGGNERPISSGTEVNAGMLKALSERRRTRGLNGRGVSIYFGGQRRSISSRRPRVRVISFSKRPPTICDCPQQHRDDCPLRKVSSVEILWLSPPHRTLTPPQLTC